MLEYRGTYDDVMRGFRWQLPRTYNIATAVAEDWARREPDRLALVHRDAAGREERWSYGRIDATANRLANGLRSLGLGRGDRIAILLPQGPETLICHLAIYKLAAIALPLSTLFGVEALSYRLEHAGARAVVANRAGLAAVAEIRDVLPDLRHVVVVDAGPAGAEPVPGLSVVDLDRLLAAASDRFETEPTGPDTPAMMIYTSGTSGPPKGALHGHRVLLGHLPGIEFVHEGFPREGDVAWTPADWAWAGGLLNLLLPSLAFGVPVIAGRQEKFDPDFAYWLIERYRVRTAFIPPTALRLMRRVDNPRGRYDLQLRTIGSAGESLGSETFEWARADLGLTVNEFYGQTECNIVIGSSAKLGVARAGLIGRCVPGHKVAIVDETGDELPAGELGQIAIRAPDPVMFLEYWRKPEATVEKFLGDWMITGDVGVMDEEGYVRFVGRDDDVITSSGYRIGPAEIEDCLAGHPAVALAAVVGRPDRLRTETVAAFVKLAPGAVPSPDLAATLRDYVRKRLSAHEYPREVTFVDEIPLTTSGKVIRRLFRERAHAEAAAEEASKHWE
ncbi:MAG: AMP-binding protein [Ancalomicrobiaceae bacterium]|nr:AMP-binding protein [Ancalomicrobiaceae bacterium]